MLRLLIIIAVSFTFLTACKNSKDGRKNSPAAPQFDGLFNPNDFNTSVSEDKCSSPGLIGPGSSWVEVFVRDIRFGDAACVKRDIQVGKIDVNIPLKEFGQSVPVLPIWMALRDSSLFFSSSKNGHFAVVKTLVEAGANINVKNESGETPLHHALQNDTILSKYPKVAAYLIISGRADDKVYNSNGETAFHVALRKKSAAHIKLFVDKKTNINFPKQNGQKSLLVAFNSDVDPTTIQLLLSNGIDYQVKDQQGNSALHLAITKKYEDVARSLIVNFNVNLNELDNNSETALLKAIQLNLSPTAQLLLDRNAMVDLRSSNTTPLHVAIEKQNANLVDRLLERVQKLSERNQWQQTVIHLLVSLGSDAQLSRAIERGFAKDEKDTNGDTPLAIAIAKDYVSRAKLLLSSGANPNSQDNKGQSVLSKAKSRAAAESLVQHNVATNVEDNKGYPEVSNFIALGNAELVGYVLDKGAQLKWAHKESGENLLMLALRSDRLGIAKDLLDRQLSPNAIDQTQQNAPFYATSIEALELLASYSTNFNQIRLDKKTLLGVLLLRYLNSAPVSSQDAEKLLLKLLDLGADVNWKDVDGKNALHMILPKINTPYAGEYPSGTKSLLKKLLEKGISLEQKDTVSKSTPLHVVNDVEELQLLLPFNPPLKSVNKDNSTAKEEKKYEISLTDSDIKEEDKKLLELQNTLQELKNQTPLKNTLIKDCEQKIDLSERRLKVLRWKRSNLEAIVALLDSVGG